MDKLDDWIATERLQDGPCPKACLVCLPHAGATHAIFDGWVRCFAPDVAVFAVSLPGRGARYGAAACETMEDLVRRLARALHGRPNPAPLAIYGECTGALIGAALAHELATVHGERVAQLFVAGYPPPGQAARQLHALDQAAFREAVLALGFIPRELAADPRTVDFFLPQIAADFRICETFDGAHLRLDCPITGLIGADDGLDPAVFEGWARVTRGPWSRVTVPYGHLLASDPQCLVRPAVKGSLMDALQRAADGSPRPAGVSIPVRC